MNFIATLLLGKTPGGLSILNCNKPDGVKKEIPRG